MFAAKMNFTKMKKTLFYTLIIATIFVSSCNDEEGSTTPTFALSALIADWNRTSTTVVTNCSTELVEIDEVEVTVTSQCPGASIEYDFTYSYDGKNTFTSTDPLFNIKLVVTELTATQLKLDWYIENTKAGSSTYVKA